MSIKFTEDQEKAINEKGNILVAAAAGSGKTAVLVERVIRNILEKGMNIDEMLVVTFTKAAATEMREKILDAIYKKMEESKSSHLSKQILLLNKANISTIHSFCFNIIKENFYRLGISPDSIVGKTEELEILKQESLDEVFDKWYEKDDKDFNSFIFNYAGYRDDENAKEEVLNFYNFLTTIPFKEDFKKDVFNFLENKEFLESEIFKDFLKDFKENIAEKIKVIERVYKVIIQEVEFLEEKDKGKAKKYILLLEKDISFLKKIYEEKSWDNLVGIFRGPILEERWPSVKVDIDEIGLARDIRNDIKKDLKDKSEKYFNRKENEIYEENIKTKTLVNLLFNISSDFEQTYTDKKKKEKILDFADLERYALNILLRHPKSNEELENVREKTPQNIIDNKYLKTDEAIKLTKRFKEIQIDEYQDINTIQEYILNSVSNFNAFQVGDIKQSIYMFRNANPNLFLKKYTNYKKDPENIEEIKGQTIKLFKNFRSRGEVLDYTNLVFSKVMSKELGDVEYKEDEYLNLGFNYNKKDKIYDPEIIYIETHSDILNDDEDLTDSEKEAIEDMNKIELESIYIKNKIREIIDEKLEVYDKKLDIYRPVTYKDIAIILRTKKDKTSVIEKTLNEAGIPVYNEESEGYLTSKEVSKVLDYLKIIDNPYLDIELLSVLRSYFWNFNLNDITEIIIYSNEKDNPNKRIYEKLEDYADEKYGEVKNKVLLKRVKEFIQNIKEYQDIAQYYNNPELIYKIIYETGYIDFVLFQNNGNIKAANLKLFIDKSFEYEKRGITNIKKLVSFLEKVEIKGDEESAKLISEDENVVRIMTMHASKGLEFPIVFLADLGKEFNEQDLRKKIILDEKLGIAAEYSDLENGIRYPTVLQNIFKTKIYRNLVSEELRILYVALTRAREKLYMIGSVKEYKEELEKLKIKGQTYINEPALSREYIKENKSFLNILTIANQAIQKDDNIKDLFKIKINVETKESFNLKENLQENKREEELKEKIEQIKNFELEDEKYKDKIEYVKNVLKNNQYGNRDEDKDKILEKNHSNLEFFQKMSVSKITQGDKINFERPKVMLEEKLSGKEKGDIIHSIFKNLDFKKEWQDKELDEYLSNLDLENEKIEVIDKNVFKRFVKSSMYSRIKEAKEVKKEENFYFTISKNELINFLNNESNKDIKDRENILIQGVIDLYFIDKNDNIILIDYKTDSGSKDNLKEMLIKNYSIQLKLYSLVLEKLYGRKVDEIYIYSTKLNEFIKL